MATLPAEQLERFENGFWKRTVPWITLTCTVVTGASHAAVVLIKRSLIETESEPTSEPVQTQAPVAPPPFVEELLFSQSEPSPNQVRMQLETLFDTPVQSEPTHQNTVPHPLDLP